MSDKTEPEREAVKNPNIGYSVAYEQEIANCATLRAEVADLKRTLTRERATSITKVVQAELDRLKGVVEAARICLTSDTKEKEAVRRLPKVGDDQAEVIKRMKMKPYIDWAEWNVAHPAPLTVRALKDYIRTHRDVDEDGEPFEVWIETSKGVSNVAVVVKRLNVGNVLLAPEWHDGTI